MSVRGERAAKRADRHWYATTGLGGAGRAAHAVQLPPATCAVGLSFARCRRQQCCGGLGIMPTPAAGTVAVTAAAAATQAKLRPQQATVPPRSQRGAPQEQRHGVRRGARGPCWRPGRAERDGDSALRKAFGSGCNAYLQANRKTAAALDFTVQNTFGDEWNAHLQANS